jgi:hypothetical protein
LSLLVVGSPCHPWLSRLLVALTGEGGTRENLIRPDSRVDRGAKGAQSQSLKVSQSPGRPGPAFSRFPINRCRSLTTEPDPRPTGHRRGTQLHIAWLGRTRPHPTAVLPGRAVSRPAAPVRGVRRRQAARNPKIQHFALSRFAIRDSRFPLPFFAPPLPPP